MKTNKNKTIKLNQVQSIDSSLLISDIVILLEHARSQSAGAVNAIMTSTYWEIGRRIVENELHNKNRAEYGEEILFSLSASLTTRFGRGFAKSNLYQMKSFYLAYATIFQTVSGKSSSKIPQVLSKSFPLSWSHYIQLLGVKNETARNFYESESLRGGWSVRQLERQIDSQFYERTALSRNKTENVVKYALENLPNKVIAAEYLTALPKETLLAEELAKTQKMLELRQKVSVNKDKKK